ncbi:MAG TPA: hypothetical protein VM680_19560, partial [Verrucomicrobiae bacterium]|nr:hypothetical protein [Verrucomicrobiae bacterium]
MYTPKQPNLLSVISVDLSALCVTSSNRPQTTSAAKSPEILGHFKQFNQTTPKNPANSTVPFCSALFRQKFSSGTAKLQLGAFTRTPKTLAQSKTAAKPSMFRAFHLFLFPFVYPVPR